MSAWENRLLPHRKRDNLSFQAPFLPFCYDFSARKYRREISTRSEGPAKEGGQDGVNVLQYNVLHAHCRPKYYQWASAARMSFEHFWTTAYPGERSARERETTIVLSGISHGAHLLSSWRVFACTIVTRDVCDTSSCHDNAGIFLDKEILRRAQSLVRDISREVLRAVQILVLLSPCTSPKKKFHPLINDHLLGSRSKLEATFRGKTRHFCATAWEWSWDWFAVRSYALKAVLILL